MILEAKNVSYFYKSNKEKLILDHVSYQFEEGKLYAVLGPSGSGKTTLLSLLAGLDTPTEGEILYAGTPVTAKDLTEHRRHHIALVFQSYNLIDYLTPVENVKLGGSGNPLEAQRSPVVWRPTAASSHCPSLGKRCKSSFGRRTNWQSG